jgi:putative tryptophan/tyrosine transport system substrate-binding protein
MSDMKRRDFITLPGGTAAWPLAARAQQMPVVGFLHSASPGGFAFYVTAFRNGLKEAGYIEGQNVAVEYRWAEGQLERLPALAADLVSRQVAVILADTRSTLIAKAATSAIPIVFTSGGDPVKLGFVTSLNRPAGNITGASFLTAAVAGKRLELLRELVPTATVVDYLVNPDNALGQPEIADAEAAARTHGLKLQVVNVVDARGEYDFDQGFRKNRPAPARRALHWRRSALPLPTPSARAARGAACDSCDLQSTRIRPHRRTNELRH